MQFDACIQRLLQKGLLIEALDPAGQTIERLAIDSREVGPSDCFVALRGTTTDGHLFIDKAVKNGATAIVSEAGPAEGDSLFRGDLSSSAGPAHARVTNAHRAAAELSSLMHADPGERLKVAAVTGTNGKTTVTALIENMMLTAGENTGFMGTTGYRTGIHAPSGGTNQIEASHTTPSAPRVYELFRRMVDTGCSTCSMEASSHALDQHRFRVEDVDVAVFTNLSRDHLDYHQTFDAYFASKKRLFDGLDADATAVFNLDDARGAEIVRDTKAQRVSFGMSGGADIRYRILENRIAGLTLEMDGRQGRFKLAGAFNASNICAAYGAGIALGLGSQDAFALLEECEPVRGRMERICFEDRTTLIVDYAHTPDALENVLRTVRDGIGEHAQLWCAFGCGGDRDKGKRPQMGQVAESCADRVVVTSDNPRTESPEAILEDIRLGMNRPEDALWLVDRREAIHESVRQLHPGDTLVLAGKGHEAVQVIGHEKLTFDDREVAIHAFASIRHTHTTGPVA